jgi:hypothetical protein
MMTIILIVPAATLLADRAVARMESDRRRPLRGLLRWRPTGDLLTARTIENGGHCDRPAWCASLDGSEYIF